MGPVEENSGFTERSNLFRKNYDPRSEYKSTGTTVIGRLMHDLVSCETGLPPNTKVKIELDRSEDAFCLMCTADDNEKYVLKIENIALYIPVAQLAAPVFQEINSLMTRKNNPQTIGIHYRRIEVRPFSLGRNKLEYNSDALYTPTEKVVDETVSNAKTEREILLERRLANMEEKLRQFENFVPKPTGKGKGRGKKSKQNQQSFQEEVAKEAERRLRSFLQQTGDPTPSTSTSFDSFPLPSAPPMENWTEDNSSVGGRSSLNPSLSVSATEKVFITKIEVTLNGTPLDQVADNQNEEECMKAYWRMFTFNGQMNSLFTNGIRKDMQLKTKKIIFIQKKIIFQFLIKCLQI